jgi:hypothetical protein
MKEQIEKILSEIPLTEKINMLESLCKKYRRENSIKLSSIQYIKSLNNGRTKASR